MQKYEFDENKNMLRNFLIHRDIDEKYQVPNPFGYIYCIENKASHKKYIGSVYSRMIGNNKPIPLTQLRKRASNYIYEYNKAVKDMTSAKQFLRPIMLAMINEGFDNFIMYPIAETDRSNHSYLEKYFISQYDTLNNGYNVNPAGANMYKIGTRLTAKDKIIRSESILAINPNKKELILSDSMKLFGDYLSSSKDMIKNANRTGRPYKGWFIFYTNPEKRHYVLYNNVINDQNKRQQDRHSEKHKTYYKELVSIVDSYLSDQNKNEYFPNFKMLDPLIYED